MNTDFRFGRRGFLVGAAAFVGTAALPRAAAAQDGRLLRIGLSAYPQNLSPWLYLGTAAESVKQQSFRGLLSYAGDASFRPEVAESWSQEADNVYVFRIRENAVFHNGDPVTAEEVKFSFESIAKPDSGAALRTAFARIESMEAVDEKTLRIVLPSADATFLGTLASYDSPIVSRRSLEENPEAPVGCGPYVVTGSERGSWIELEAFPDYYRPGYPKSKTLRFIAYTDENARTSALLSGDVELIDYVPAFSMQSIRDNPDLTLDAVEGPATLVMFNCKEGPFVDPRVRRAVGYAIDRQAVIDGAFAGEAVKAGPLPISRASEFYDPSIEDYFERDLDRARALLAEAGHPNGFKTTLLATSQYSVHRDPAIVIQQSLVEIGIEVDLNLPDWATRIQLGNAGQYHISVTATGFDNNDPSALTSLLSSTVPDSFSRPFGYKNETIDRLLAESVAEVDPARRKEIFAELGKVHVEDPAALSVVFRNQAYAWSNTVRGFRNVPGFASFNSGITIEDVEFV